MDVFKAIHERRSIMSYRDIPISQQQIFEILQAAAFAPSAGNLQDWRFIIVKDASKKRKIAEACHQQMWMVQAPVHIVACADTQRAKQHFQARGQVLYAIQSVAAAIQNILLSATHLGLASCWVGAFDEEQLSAAVKVPDTARVQAVVTLGYANEIRPTPQKQPLKSYIFLENYGSVLSDDEMKLLNWDYSGLVSAKSKQAMLQGKSIFKDVANAIKRKKK